MAANIQMPENVIRFKLNISYLAAYGAMAFYSPYLIIYFKYRNLSYNQIGILFAFLSLTGVISQPFWGYISDKYLNAKITLSIGMFVSSICIFFVMFSSSFWTIFISIVIVAFFQNPIYSILDAFCYDISSQYKSIHYENVRQRGSLGYALSVLAAGYIIKNISIYASFSIYCILSAVGIFSVATIKYNRLSSGNTLSIKDVVFLFKERRFTLFIISVTVLNIAMGANGSYIEELIRQVGGDVSNLGILWLIVALSEIPVFFFGNRILNKYKDLKLFYLSIFFLIIRLLADSISFSWIMVALVQLMQSVTFALYLISALHYLNRVVDPKMRMSGMAIYSAMGGGLGNFTGNLFGGILLSSISIFNLYRLLAAVCLVSLAIGLTIEGKYKIKRNAAS